MDRVRARLRSEPEDAEAWGVVLSEAQSAPLAAALRPGLSVTVQVNVKGQTGASFADAATGAQMAASQKQTAP